MNKEAFVFPGQGSQRVGMAEKLLKRSWVAREIFNRANEVLQDFGWERSIIELCLYGPEGVLDDTEFAQPTIFVASIAAYLDLVSQGRVPWFVAGHSLGEYSALTAAGSLNFDEGVRLVAERGRLMKEIGEIKPGSMAAILGLTEEQVEKLCQDITGQLQGSSVQIASINAPGQIVISGNKDAINQAVIFTKELSAKKIYVLPVSIASHSELMRGAQEGMTLALESVTLKEPKIPFISSTKGDFVQDPEEIRELLVAQLTGRVLWVDTVMRMIEAGSKLFVEVGPGKVLLGLIKRIDETVQVDSLNI